MRIEVSVNDDPETLGCFEVARSFPYCRAKIEPEGLGYRDILGWVQLLDSSYWGPGFRIDEFEPLGTVPHPFAFYGLSPTFFDAPHSDQVEDWDFLAHTFLCGLGGELMERKEARALLGFSWGFSKRGRQIEWFGPDALASEAWDGHLAYLHKRHPEWTFAPGFLQDPLEP